MKQINLDTKVNLYTKTILSDYNVFLIFQLYMPIIGTEGVSLYVHFSNLIKMNKRATYLGDLVNQLSVSLNDVIQAKKKLEAVGLMSSYVSSNKDLSIVLYSPKSPKKFFDDIVLSGLLRQRISIEKVLELKDYFKMDSLDKSNLEDDSANFMDVFSVDFDSQDFKYDPNKNEVLLDFKSKSSRLKFDIEYFLSNLRLKENDDSICFSKKEANDIVSLANLYGYNEDLMIDIVGDCINSTSKSLDLTKLKKACFNNQLFDNSNMKRSHKKEKIVVSSSDSIMAQKIKFMEKLSPYQYLQLKQNNVKPVQSDMNILTRLATDLGLTNGVINALVDYVLETNNNILSRNLIEKIGATLVRENVESAYDALNFLTSFNTKYEKCSGSAEILKEKEEKKLEKEDKKDQEIDDIWKELGELG